MRVKPGSIGLSLLLHAVVLTLLVVSFEHTRPEVQTPAPQEGKPVRAVAADARQVAEEIARLKAQQAARRSARDKRERAAEAAVRKAAAARKREQARLAALKRKAVAEQRRQAAAQKAEQQRLAKLKAQRKAEQQKLAEAARQRKIAAQKQRQEEAARRKAAAAAKAKRAAEAQLKQQMAVEAARLKAQRAQQLAAARSEYVDLIAAKVARNWLRPAGTPDDFSCKVLVQQIPGGEVVGVKVMHSCGSPALDLSVENAVRRASPLPTPSDPSLFDKEIVFTFIPRG